MRLTAVVTFFAAAGLLFAGTCVAQDETPAPQTQESTAIQREPQNGEWQMPNRMMGPNDQRIGRPIVISRSGQQHDRSFGGPLHIFSELESDLDNPRIQAALGLTTQQVDSLRSLLVDTEIHTIQTGAGMVVDGIQLKELLRSDHPDRSAVMAKGNAISQSVSQLVDQYLDAILKAKTILTPQQQDMIRRYMAMHGQEMGSFGFGGPDMGGPGFRATPER
jgi:hypothetical protein